MCDTSGYNTQAIGRFAPSPTGRMHLGNIMTAVLSWLSVKSRGGRWILRIEDLDPQRSRLEHVKLIEDDLLWLGLEWDEGGLDDLGPSGPYTQSRRYNYYEEALRRLTSTGQTYPCTCTRADLLATQAPHQSDGRRVYTGSCRPLRLGGYLPDSESEARQRVPHTVRLYMPQGKIEFTDRLYGRQQVDLSKECGDFVLRRADGAWSYQLAVVVDDAMMGVTEVVRGHDLLLSAAQQIYLYRLLGYREPEFAHVPLVCNSEGRRLSKRDASLSMESLRRAYTPEQLLGIVGSLAGLCTDYSPITLTRLLEVFSWERLRSVPIVTVPEYKGCK
ncbi:MAG: tRNA glutamyl-Q(34) synthetase GluQRS [Muribaculaceae bacterium]|nr:tRNA glutamyl-Q(34) synthetase GluQRS [Muribaculaceae bacterium]